MQANGFFRSQENIFWANQSRKAKFLFFISLLISEVLQFACVLSARRFVHEAGTHSLYETCAASVARVN